MQRNIHSPGLVPAFALATAHAAADEPPGLDLWRGIPGGVGYPDRWQFVTGPSPDDSTYISQGLNHGGTVYVGSDGSMPAGLPPAPTVIYRIRARRMGGTGTWTFNYGLLRGGVSIFAITGVVLSLSFVTLERTLTVGEVAAFMGGSGNIQWNAHGSGGPGTDAFEVSWHEVAFYAP